MSGWIKLHRSFQKWEWYDQTNCVTVFVDLLISANFEDGKYRGVHVPRGSLTTSYGKIAERTGLTVQQVRTVLKKLISTREITVHTTNLYTMISITNWNKYQVEVDQDNKPITNKQQTDNKQVTTSKKLRNKEVKNNTPLFEVEPLQLSEEISAEELPVKILTAFNAICFKGCQPTPFNLGKINARLKEGYKYEDFLKVIKFKFEEWKDSSVMRAHINPGTFFCGKFDGYLEAAKSADKPILDPLDEFFKSLGCEPQRIVS